MPDISTTIVLGDVHLPVHSRKAVALAFDIIATVQPKRVVQIGDLLDGYSLSRHSKDPTKHISLESEVAAGRRFVSTLLSLCKETYWTQGNHDLRLERYIADNAPALAATHPTIPALLGFPEKNYVPYRQVLQIGKVAYTHDLGFSGRTALRASLDAYGSNVVFGHTHRAGVLYGGDARGQRTFGMNVGWLGDPEAADYLHMNQRRDWQWGVGVVRQDRKGLAWATFVPFVQDGNKLRAILDGQLFER